MELLENAKKHFKTRLENAELADLEVPEWGGSIYYPVTISLLRKDRIMKAIESGGLEHMVDIILEIARESDGSMMFPSSKKKQCRKDLMEKVDPDVLMRVAGELSDILAPSSDDVQEGEEALKNSKAIRSSEGVSGSQTEED